MSMPIRLDQPQRDTLARLRGLNLAGMAKELEMQWETLSVYADMSFDDRFRSLLAAQEDDNKARRSSYLTKMSKIKIALDFNEIYADADRGFPIELKAELATLRFINSLTNILVQGSSGSGKSTLIGALGKLCCRMGHSALYFNTRDLLSELLVEDYRAKMRLRQKIRRVKVLILDDFGLAPITQEMALELFAVLEDRINTGPVIIGTQLKLQGMARAMQGCNNQTIDANMRRITERSIKIVLNGNIHDALGSVSSKAEPQAA